MGFEVDPASVSYLTYPLTQYRKLRMVDRSTSTPIKGPPDPNEQGWKETVRMNPGEVTRVIMKFDLPVLPASMGNPLSPRTGGHEYVHHCHILEHEEHDMMRALVVR